MLICKVTTTRIIKESVTTNKRKKKESQNSLLSLKDGKKAKSKKYKTDKSIQNE